MPMRPRFRFRLFVFLICLPFFALVFIYAYEARKNEIARVHAESAGFIVEHQSMRDASAVQRLLYSVFGDWYPQPIVSLQYNGSATSVQKFLRSDLSNFRKLSWLLVHAKLDDTTVRDLSGLPQLRTLVLSDFELVQDGLRCLKHFPNLSRLELSGEIHDGCLEYLDTSLMIETLSISSPNFTGSSLEYLNRMPRLRGLRLGGPLTSVNLHRIPQLPSLQGLAIAGNALNDRDLSFLKQFPNLERLELDISGSADVLQSIPAETGISELRLHGMAVSQDSFHAIGRLPKLRTISLIHCDVAELALAPLGNSNTLSQITVSCASISGSFLPVLDQANYLLLLDVRQNRIEDFSASDFVSFQGLVTLKVNNSPTKCQFLSGFHPDSLLEVLDLRDTLCNDEEIEKLPVLSFLTEIDLSQTEVTGKVLKHLAKFPRLRTVRMSDRDVTENQQLEFRRERSEVRLELGFVY